MTQIVDFVQVRVDGKLVPATMTVKEMLDLGWEPSKVTALRWTHDGRINEFHAPDGVHGIVVPGANFIAAICSANGAFPGDRLIILLHDGSVYGELSNFLSISGNEMAGGYVWFEPAMEQRTNTFGVIFQTIDQVTLRCDVDASGPSVTSAIKIP